MNKPVPVLSIVLLFLALVGLGSYAAFFKSSFNTLMSCRSFNCAYELNEKSNIYFESRKIISENLGEDSNVILFNDSNNLDQFGYDFSYTIYPKQLVIVNNDQFDDPFAFKDNEYTFNNLPELNVNDLLIINSNVYSEIDLFNNNQKIEELYKTDYFSIYKVL